MAEQKIICRYCGQELEDGEICKCRSQSPTKESDYIKISFNKENVKKAQKKFADVQKKLNESISTVETNSESDGSDNTVHAVDGAFEKDLKIVDTCIVPTEREIPIRQYKIAKLRTPFLKKAFGRLQVTNKRVIFRAAGKSFLGPIITEKEFAIEELSGVEVKSDYNFSFPVLFISILEIVFMTIMFVWLAFGLKAAGDGDPQQIEIAFAFLYAILGLILYAASHNIRTWSASLLFSAGILFSSAALTNLFSMDYLENLAWALEDGVSSHSSSTGIWTIFCLVSVLGGVILTILSGFVDDLQIIVKIKGAHDAINVSRTMIKHDWTGFMIIKPWKDTNLAIQELGALITDIKQHGDYAIKKWCI